ncbi:MAG: peptide deformylase [candidate division WOR-3 bacterium]
MEGENRKIRLYGDPILRVITKPVKKIDKEIQKIIADLKKTMLCQDGLGLAANQIGESYAIFVYNPRALGIDQDPIAVINPKIIERQGNQEQEEACLSLPGIVEVLARPSRVKLIGIDEKGKEITLSGSGLLARVFCHEIDHLNGILFIDHLSKMRRHMLKRQLDSIIEKCK